MLENNQKQLSQKGNKYEWLILFTVFEFPEVTFEKCKELHTQSSPIISDMMKRH